MFYKQGRIVPYIKVIIITLTFFTVFFLYNKSKQLDESLSLNINSYSLYQSNTLEFIELALLSREQPEELSNYLMRARENAYVSYSMTNSYIGSYKFPIALSLFQEKLWSVTVGAHNEIVSDGSLQDETLNLLVRYRDILKKISEISDYESLVKVSLDGKYRVMSEISQLLHSELY